ncbi:unnamed protein product [Musa acuminata var. zebrina]
MRTRPRDDDNASSSMWPKQSRGASSSHSDSKPGRGDAREFLAIVKRALHNEAHTHDQFLDIMKSLENSSITPIEASRRVENYLKCILTWLCSSAILPSPK